MKEPIGPYSHFKLANGLVFTSGQIPDDSSADIRTQAEQAIKNLTAVLEEAGSGLEHTVKITCYLKSMEDFAAFNEVYARYFINRPARSCIQAAKLPRDVLVEIDAIAEIK